MGNPVVDLIRVVTSTNSNYRLNPTTGSLIATDTMLAFVGGAGTPSVPAIAYSNNYPGGGPAGPFTTLYGYDVGTDSLVTIGGESGGPSPNGGQVFTVGPSTLFASPPRIGMDIHGNASNAFMNATVSVGPAVVDRFYSVPLGPFSPTLVGTFPFLGVEDIATVSIPEPSLAGLLGLGLAGAVLRRRRKVVDRSGRDGRPLPN